MPWYWQVWSASLVIVAFIRLIEIQTTVDKQANRMAKMDEYGRKGREAFEKSNDYLEEGIEYLKNYDIENAVISMNSSKEYADKWIQYFEKASEYAEGPYKEFLEMLIDYLKTRDPFYDYFNKSVEAYYAGDSEAGRYYELKRKECLDEMGEKHEKMGDFFEEHPDEAKHIEENWK